MWELLSPFSRQQSLDQTDIKEKQLPILPLGSSALQAFVMNPKLRFPFVSFFFNGQTHGGSDNGFCISIKNLSNK